jgi:hypothetical protein
LPLPVAPWLMASAFTWLAISTNWSSKNLWHRWTGQWKVEVINQHNQILLTKTFEYKKEENITF